MFCGLQQLCWRICVFFLVIIEMLGATRKNTSLQGKILNKFAYLVAKVFQLKVIFGLADKFSHVAWFSLVPVVEFAQAIKPFLPKTVDLNVAV